MDNSFEPIFHPRSVAVIGASRNPSKLGRYCLRALIEGGFSGKIYPINPHASTVLGLEAFSSVADVPGEVDLAVIVVPAAVVPRVFRQCAEKGVKGTVIITAGFKEDRREIGRKLQQEITAIADSGGIRVIGPNSFGAVNLYENLNASFTPTFSQLKKGSISLVSQSGGICHTLLALALDEDVGFAKIVHVGNRCNVGFADLLEYLRDDDETEVITMYVEGVEEARRLMNVARQVVEKKPIVAYKVGKADVADEASRSHTGTLAGNYDLYIAAFRQAGVITVYSCVELLDTARVLATQPLPGGDRFAIISIQAGPAMAATDICHEHHLTTAKFCTGTEMKLKKLLPPLTLRTNPVDASWAGTDPGRFKQVTETVLRDKNVDALLLLYAYTPSWRFPVDSVVELSKNYRKPIVVGLASPQKFLTQQKAELRRSGVSVYPTPERAAKAFSNLLNYAQMRRL